MQVSCIVYIICITIEWVGFCMSGKADALMSTN